MALEETDSRGGRLGQQGLCTSHGERRSYTPASPALHSRGRVSPEPLGHVLPPCLTGIPVPLSRGSPSKDRTPTARRKPLKCYDS